MWFSAQEFADLERRVSTLERNSQVYSGNTPYPIYHVVSMLLNHFKLHIFSRPPTTELRVKDGPEQP